MGIFDWSDKGPNEGLTAGEKDDPSGDGSGAGAWWSRSDGTSGQSETTREDDGSVTHYQHDRDGEGGETVSSTTYHKDGSTSFDGHKKH